jgi:DNA end-binding protein Ku
VYFRAHSVHRSEHPDPAGAQMEAGLCYMMLNTDINREEEAMARAFWKGVISFGMVVIPVRMYVATSPRGLSFHVLHKKCFTRPKQVWRCEKDEEYFTAADTVRGYEFTKGNYVVMTEEDFNKVSLKSSHAINIQGFVEEGEIDPVYYQNSHYLDPEELGKKPFILLRDALVKTRRVGVAKVTFQKREHLCVLRPLGEIMALHTLFYKDEILSRSELSPDGAKVSAEEMEMATNLVKAMAASFKPEQYKDEYEVALKKLIESKMKGIEVKMPEEEKIEVPDLMSALKASIEAARKKPVAVPAGKK